MIFVWKQNKLRRRTKCYFSVHLLQEEKMTFDYSHLPFFNFSTCLFSSFFVFVFRFLNRLWWRRLKDCEMFNKDDEKRQQKGVIIISSSFMISPMPLPSSLLCKSSLLHNKKEHEEDESSQQQHKKKRMQWHAIKVVVSLLDV